MNTFEAIFLAFVEGITEFLPVSSTGHMIIASSFFGNANSDFVKMFTVAIQFGAILSVVYLYWKRFFLGLDFYLKLFVAFLPAAVFGFLFNDYIDSLLENVTMVAITLLLGGIVFLYIDKLFAKAIDKDQEPSYIQAFLIGMFQVIAMIPGVSRSAATIIGGLSQGMNRKSAAEFSFFLAVPTMFAATAYKILKYFSTNKVQSSELSLLLLGNVVAFIVAIFAIKGFIGFLTKHGFKAFGWYRIALGLILLLLGFLGYDLQVI